MKKQLFLAIILIFTVGLLMAGTPRTYIQKCTLDTGLEAPVTNTGTTTSPDYIVRATIVETGETLGTDLGTPVTSIRISRAGNGTSVPYYTATNLQLGTFPTQWVAGQTIHMYVQYIPTLEVAEWNLVIPAGTTLINIQDPPQIIPPATVVADTYTYNLAVTASDGLSYAFTGPQNGTTPAALTSGPLSEAVNPLVGTYTVTDPAPVGWHWLNPVIEVTGDMFTAPPVRTDYVYNAEIQFVLEEDVIPDTWTYRLFVNGPDGYAVTGPANGTTDYVITDAGDQTNDLLGLYTIEAAPAGYYWAVNPIEVIADMFALVPPAKNSGLGSRNGNLRTDYVYEATIEFVLMQYPAFVLNVNGPDGYAVTGPVAGVTDYVATDNNDMINDLTGSYEIAAAPAGFYWLVNPIVVSESDFVDNVATIEFVLMQEPDVYNYTLYVYGPDGTPITGPAAGVCDYMAQDLNNDGINELLGTYTAPAAPAGWHWIENPIVVEAADFMLPVKATYDYQATIEFVLEEDQLVPIYTLYINAFNAYTMAPLAANIFYDADGDGPIAPVAYGITPSQFYYYGAGHPANTYNPGRYYVELTGYTEWIPVAGNFLDITTDYTIDFLGVPEQVNPVELSSFTATLTGQFYVELKWTSQTETQLMGYRVYRNTTPDQSSSMLIDSPMIPATNTSTSHTYTVVDQDVISGTTYYYWLEAVDFNASTYHGPVSVTVNGNVPPVLPEQTTMKNAYPNPFRAGSSTNIEVSLKAGEAGTVTIYNVLGQVVRTISVTEGNHMINWNGRDSRGNACGSGIYFYKLSTPSINMTKKMVIVK
jgi:hypothetical protein